MKFINGELFDGLNILKTVFLTGNECIDEKFVSLKEIKLMPLTVTKKCGFVETVEEVTVKSEKLSIKVVEAEMKACEEVLETKEAKLSLMESFLNKTSIKNEVCRLEVSKLQKELVAAQSLAVKSVEKLEKEEKAKNEAQRQILFIKEIHERLDASRNVTFKMRTEELRKNLQTKLSEIDKLVKEVQKKTAEISEKNRKIKELEKKLKPT